MFIKFVVSNIEGIEKKYQRTNISSLSIILQRQFFINNMRKMWLPLPSHMGIMFLLLSYKVSFFTAFILLVKSNT